MPTASFILLSGILMRTGCREKAGEDGSFLFVVSCNRMIWNMACDIYISKFLRDIKFGSPTCGNPADFFSGNLADERKIYQYLMEHGNTEDNKSICGSTASYASFGTARGMDMRGLEQPRVYDAKRNQKNEFVTNFAYALAYSVSNVVSEAGGHGATDARTQTRSEKAAQWFISHYPLLGGLASGFKVIEDYSLCNREEISVAAVNVAAGEIYVNPAAGLDFEELKFVLAHEFLHAGLMHHERLKGRDPYLFNVACDYVVNGWLCEMGIGKMPDRGLFDESLTGVSAESLYHK